MDKGRLNKAKAAAKEVIKFESKEIQKTRLRQLGNVNNQKEFNQFCDNYLCGIRPIEVKRK